MRIGLAPGAFLNFKQNLEKETLKKEYHRHIKAIRCSIVIFISSIRVLFKTGSTDFERSKFFCVQIVHLSLNFR